jgi:hypothetical protein
VIDEIANNKGKMKNQYRFKKFTPNSIVILIIVLSTAIAAISSTLLADDYDDYQARKARADAEWQAKRLEQELRNSQRELDRLEAGMRKTEENSLLSSSRGSIIQDPETVRLAANRQQIAQNIDLLRTAQSSRLLTESELNWLEETADTARKMYESATTTPGVSGREREVAKNQIPALPFLETINLMIQIENENRQEVATIVEAEKKAARRAARARRSSPVE